MLPGGRKQPRTGGLILSRQSTRAEVVALFDADPLVAADLARYSITEFTPLMWAPELAGVC